jgi:hypothetical protein
MSDVFAIFACQNTAENNSDFSGIGLDGQGARDVQP